MVSSTDDSVFVSRYIRSEYSLANSSLLDRLYPKLNGSWNFKIDKIKRRLLNDFVKNNNYYHMRNRNDDLKKLCENIGNSFKWKRNHPNTNFSRTSNNSWRMGRHTVVPRAMTYRMGNTSRQSERGGIVSVRLVITLFFRYMYINLFIQLCHQCSMTFHNLWGSFMVPSI